MHQVSFSQSGASVNKKRIISISRRFRNCKSCCLGKFIVASYNKAVKSIFWIQMSFLTSLIAKRFGFRHIIGRNFFFRDIFRKNKLDFTAFHSRNLADCNLKRQSVFFIYNI